MSNTINSFWQQADFAMPTFDRARVASVRALPMSTGFMSAGNAQRIVVDATPVCGYAHITGGAVLKGDFPGTPVWSPPN